MRYAYLFNKSFTLISDQYSCVFKQIFAISQMSIQNIHMHYHIEYYKSDTIGACRKLYQKSAFKIFL